MIAAWAMRYDARSTEQSPRGAITGWGAHPFWRLANARRWVGICQRAAPHSGYKVTATIYDRWRRRQVPVR